MTAQPRLCTINELREHLLDRLNHSLLFSDMYGGVHAVEVTLEDLVYIDGREDELRFRRECLKRRGAFRSTGLQGGFASVFGHLSSAGASSEDRDAACMILAQEAHHFGLLRPSAS